MKCKCGFILENFGNYTGCLNDKCTQFEILVPDKENHFSMSMISEGQRNEIRRRSKNKDTYKAIAKDYNCSVTCIAKIVNFKD